MVSKSLQEASKSVQELSRWLQEPFKRLSRGFLKASTSKMRFGTHFGPVLSDKMVPWDLKNHGNPVYCRQKSRFRNFHLESSPGPDLGTSRAPFWEHVGPQDASKTTSRAPKTRPRPPKRPPRRLQERPRGLPGRSKRPPRPRQEAFRRPRGSKRTPGNHFGLFLPPFSILIGRGKHPPTTLRTTVCVYQFTRPRAFTSSPRLL